jgi:hypothetical protein
MSESSQQELKIAGAIKTGTHWERMNAPLLRIKTRLPELEELAGTLGESAGRDRWGTASDSCRVSDLETRKRLREHIGFCRCRRRYQNRDVHIQCLIYRVEPGA